ncbi:MAG: DUF2341 domain-containing protein [Candidatus Bathyarchaeota archaeon]|nr:DUF2341 domain-containing protein [Candidatus Bathyarchaeota archaeon]
MSENQTAKTQLSDFPRALNKMLDNIENVVDTLQERLQAFSKKMEKLESSEKSPRGDAALKKKRRSTEEMKQPTKAAKPSAETPVSPVISEVEVKQRTPYLKIRFALGLITLIIGFIAANFVLFHWVEQTVIYDPLGDYARYVCAYGGFAAMIFGAMAVNDFLVLRKVLKGKHAKDKETVDRRHKNGGKIIAASALAILLFMLCPIVVSSTVSYTATATITPRNWWNHDYEYRSQMTIDNYIASALGSGYSVYLDLDTAALISNGKMLPSGNDLRILHLNASSWIELDCNVIDMNTSSTQVWFKIQADISASGSDNNYYMYYGNPSAGTPPANKSNVYLLWDDFNDGDYDGWTPVGSTWNASSGFLDNKDPSGTGKYIRKDGYNVTESVLIEYKGLIHVDEENLVYLNVPGTVNGSSTGSGYCLGINADTDMISIERIDNGSRTAIDSISKVIDPDVWYNITIVYFTNGTMSTEVAGSKVTVTDTTYSTPYEFGTWCQYEASYDDVMVRKYAFPEPSAHTGPEQSR